MHYYFKYFQLFLWNLILRCNINSFRVRQVFGLIGEECCLDC